MKDTIPLMTLIELILTDQFSMEKQKDVLSTVSTTVRLTVA